MKEKKIVPKQSVVMVYLCDGKMLNFPIAKNIKRNYKKPRWLPMVFWTPEQLARFK